MSTDVAMGKQNVMYRETVTTRVAMGKQNVMYRETVTTQAKLPYGLSVWTHWIGSIL